MNFCYVCFLGKMDREYCLLLLCTCPRRTCTMYFFFFFKFPFSGNYAFLFVQGKEHSKNSVRICLFLVVNMSIHSTEPLFFSFLYYRRSNSILWLLDFSNVLWFLSHAITRSYEARRCWAAQRLTILQAWQCCQRESKSYIHNHKTVW